MADMPSTESANVACPKCRIGILRRLERHFGTGFFWACSRARDCRAAFPDDAGRPLLAAPSPSSEHQCPTCAESLRRIAKKLTAGHFWNCHACHAKFEDRDGQPLLASATPESEHNCPKCGKGSLRLARKMSIGFFWACTRARQCRAAFPDKGGMPDFSSDPTGRPRRTRASDDSQ
jgi:ssDNA-binding Zn-finger/Zn-ribbon topoisomerase 1